MFIIFSLVFIDSFHFVLIFMAWQLPPLVFLAPYLVIRSLTFIFYTRIFYLFFVFALILPRLPFRVFNLASPFFFFFFDFWFLIWNFISFHSTAFFFNLIDFHLSWMIVHDTLLSFLMHFHFSWLDWTHFFSKLALTTWWKFLHSLPSFFLFFCFFVFFWLKSFLAWWPSLFCFSQFDVFSKILSLLDGFPFFLALMNSLFWTWWIFLFWTCHIVFIEDLTKGCWIHKVNTSSSWDLSMHT